jgi:hypothetical protein
LIAVIWLDNSLDSPVVTLAAMTGLDTLQARPRAALEGKKMYGTFCEAEKNKVNIKHGRFKEPDAPFLRKGGEGGGGFREALYQQSG